MWSWLRGSLIVLPCLLAGPARAVNPALMPGDAFFHSTLTAESLESFGDKGIGLEYVYPPGSMAFCGYAGFERLEVVGDTAAISESVKAVYRALRRDFELELRVDSAGKQKELNGFDLFVYPKEVRWSRSTVVGLKYNEDWASLPPEAAEGGSSRSRMPGAKAEARYTTFVEGAPAVLLDWQHGEKVPALGVRYSSGLAWGVPGSRLEAAATIDAEDIQVIITPNKLEDIFIWMTQSPEFDDMSYSQFFSVTSEGVTQWHSGDWDLSEEGLGELNALPWSPNDSKRAATGEESLSDDE